MCHICDPLPTYNDLKQMHLKTLLNRVENIVAKTNIYHHKQFLFFHNVSKSHRILFITLFQNLILFITLFQNLILFITLFQNLILFITLFQNPILFITLFQNPSASDVSPYMKVLCTYNSYHCNKSFYLVGLIQGFSSVCQHLICYQQDMFSCSSPTKRCQNLSSTVECQTRVCLLSC